MARMSRLLGAVMLGVAVTAAVGSAVVTGEHNPVRRSPTHLPQASGSGRVIVKFKERASILAASGSRTATDASVGPQKASAMSARLGMALSDGRPLGPRTQVMMASGVDS